MIKKSLFILSFSFLAIIYLAAVSNRGETASIHFTIEDVMSAPYPTNLVSSPNGGTIAWVANQKGIRNIWITKTADLIPIQLTNFSEDDGQEISELTFSRDGSLLFFVRGGNPNRYGEYPNPTSNPQGAEQAVWASYIPYTPWKIGKGHNPRISPDGSKLLLTLKGKVYISLIKDAKKGISTLPRLFFHVRGTCSSLQWSPDGSSVLFVSNRKNHSFIGIYFPSKRKISWIAPGVDMDMFPVWSPDSKHVAFFRFPGRKKHQLFNMVGGSSVKLMVGNIETGKANIVWSISSDREGFAQFFRRHPLRWTSDNMLVFYSEHKGWIHIYSIPSSGGSVVELTPGEAEAETSSISHDGKTLYFSSNMKDVDRRHIWRVSIKGGSPECLTPGQGIETDPVTLNRSPLIIFRKATARKPQAIYGLNLRTKKELLISPKTLPKNFPENKLTIPRQVIFKSLDGLKIHGQLFLPPDFSENNNRSALIFMHGGPIRQMLLGWHYSKYYANAYAMNQYLANHGYVVLAVNYRSGVGYGMCFRRAKNQGPRGASEYKDILAAGKFLSNMPGVNPHKIGLWGGSYGGYLTALGLARNSDLFAAGVDLHGVHDWSFRATDFSPGGGWAIQGKKLLQQAYLSSPVADLTFWTSPVLIIQGDDDRNVLFEQSIDLVQRLRALGVHVETLVFPDEVHDFLRYTSWLKAYKSAADFFDRFLKSKGQK